MQGVRIKERTNAWGLLKAATAIDPPKVIQLVKIGRYHWIESAVVESEQSFLARQSRKIQYASLYRRGEGGAPTCLRTPLKGL